ncbi:hypothetical protein BH23PSE1_BH23PSE1_00230 [soil metagenome]
MKRLAAALVICGLAVPAGAVTIDLNRDPLAAIVPNGAGHVYGGVGTVNATCTGTPLTRRLVLTAAHCVAGSRSATFSLPLARRTISRRGTAASFPGYDFSLEPFEQIAAPDLAVLRLARGLPRRVPTYALLQSAAMPLGHAFEVVGYGGTGIGTIGGLWGSESVSVKRFARNELDRADPSGLFFSADFDGGRLLAPGAPTGPGSTGLERWNRVGSLGTGILEGGIFVGDSGGPAFYSAAIAAEVLGESPRQPAAHADRPLVIGVASFITQDGFRPY